MTMIGENGTPETPDWSVDCRPWDNTRCCPSCTGIIESAQQHIYPIGENVVLGEE